MARMKCLSPFFTLLFLLSIASAKAQEAMPPDETPLTMLRAQAAALRQQADKDSAAAEAEYQAADAACWQRFLVNRCKDQALVKKQEQLAAARELKHQSLALERRIREREYAAHSAQQQRDVARSRATAAKEAAKNKAAREETQRQLTQKRREREKRDSAAH